MSIRLRNYTYVFTGYIFICIQNSVFIKIPASCSFFAVLETVNRPRRLLPHACCTYTAFKSLHLGPQILKKIEEALLNKHFSDSVLDQYLCALKEEWME